MGGGMSTWEAGSSRSDLFAAVAPVAAHHKVDHEALIAKGLRRTPVLAVHSHSDDTCLYRLEEALWQRLMHTEGNDRVEVQVAPRIDHCSMYERTYCDDSKLYEWLLQFSLDS